ncbi:MAG: GNAT family N-acetyltransferase [Propionibacteriaceae bacterium]|jgi:predicted acetyltransferase|nr:GNAT family N-acetyltransferase [Propionibacteriaceae bacterium]
MNESDYRLVEVGPDRAEEYWGIVQWSFGAPSSPAEVERRRRSLDWSRTVGCETCAGTGPGRLVAVSTSWRFDLPVPGGRTPAAGLTWVGVHPERRRQGLLRALIARHLADCARRGEPVSVLTAAEAPIYPRFGYGQAIDRVELTIPSRAGLISLPGSERIAVELVDAEAERWSDQVESIHQQAGQGPWARPGWVPCVTSGMVEEHFEDLPEHRGQAETLKLALAYREGRPSGYAFFQRTPKWVHGRAVGAAQINELVALDPLSAHALWERMLDLDLVEQVTSPLHLPVDDPILDWLVDPRCAQPRWGDAVWLRLVDLPAAWAARRLSAPVDLVLEVTDQLIEANAGRWRLVGGPDRTSLTRTDQAPDLSLDIKELGRLYLGGGSVGALAQAGLITASDRSDPAALARLDAACHHWLAPGLTRLF